MRRWCEFALAVRNLHLLKILPAECITNTRRVFHACELFYSFSRPPAPLVFALLMLVSWHNCWDIDDMDIESWNVDIMWSLECWSWIPFLHTCFCYPMTVLYGWVPWSYKGWGHFNQYKKFPIHKAIWYTSQRSQDWTKSNTYLSAEHLYFIL